MAVRLWKDVFIVSDSENYYNHIDICIEISLQLKNNDTKWSNYITLSMFFWLIYNNEEVKPNFIFIIR